jgi:hypothetical protein
MFYAHCSEGYKGSHGTSLFCLRQEADVGQQHFSRAQRDQAALERQPASGPREGEWRDQVRPRLYPLPPLRQSRKSVVHSPESHL